MTTRRLPGAVTVVTGGSRGIGLAIARATRRAGACVIIADLAPPDPGADAQGLEWRALDVTEVAATGPFFASVAADYGPIAVLVNNAGVLARAPIAAVRLEMWQRVIRVNLEAAFFVTQAALRHFASPGAVVNVASTSAFVAGGGQAVYEASKAGVVMLTRSLAVELGDRGIRVNAVAPGLIDTPMTRALWPDPAAFEQRVRDKVPLGRAGRPEDVAEAVVFLASGEAGYMTGETLVVDGGWLLA